MSDKKTTQMIEYTVKVYPDGEQRWFLNGKRHREDGPAVINPDGYQCWYLKGEELTEEEFNNRHNVELTLEQIAEKFNIDVNNLKIKK